MYITMCIYTQLYIHILHNHSITQLYIYYGLDYFVMLQKMKVRIYLLSTPKGFSQWDINTNKYIICVHLCGGERS